MRIMRIALLPVSLVVRVTHLADCPAVPKVTVQLSATGEYIEVHAACVCGVHSAHVAQYSDTDYRHELDKATLAWGRDVYARNAAQGVYERPFAHVMATVNTFRHAAGLELLTEDMTRG